MSDCENSFYSLQMSWFAMVALLHLQLALFFIFFLNNRKWNITFS